MSVAAAAVIVFGVLPLISSAPELRRFPRDGKTLVVDEKNSSEVATLEESGMLITADSRLQFSCADREDGAYADSSSSRIYYRCRGGRREARSCAAGREFSARTARCEPRGDPPPPCEALGDGLHADHASGCQQYFRCENGSATRASCGEGQRFSAARGACCPAGDVWCVRPLCAGDEGAFAEPGSRCRAYYRCRAGRASQLACPAGAAFSARDQECVAGAAREPCYELLCTGRVNGDYADSSHGCRRSFRCEGGEVRAVRGCPAGSLHDGRACRPAAEVTCPPPHASAVALPADDCAGLPDGPRPAAGCRVYRLCRGGRTLATLRWEGAPCPPPAPADPCAGRADGLGPDYASGCGAHVRCGGGALLARLRCEGARVFDGSACVAEGDFSCEGPEPWLGCAALADGLHADLGPDSRCRRYFLCHRGNRTRLACPRGQVFDGRSCVPAGDYRCPALPQDACQDKPDGYYRDADSGCRSYFFCSNGHKITYLCAGSYVFDGTECVAPDAYECPFSSEDCVGRANGYHAAAESDCRKYYYCLDGDKITTLMCDDDKVFDGRRCVDPSVFQCTIPYSADAGVCHGRSDGWFADFNNGCRNYFQCIGGRKAADASCPDGKVFDSSSCVDARTYSGCLALESSNNVVPSVECSNTLSGFYQNITSGCKSYYYCIDGIKTTLSCPGNQLFNGQLCVDSNSYTCPVPVSMSLQTRTSHSIEYKSVIKSNYQNYAIFYIIFVPLL